MKKIIFTFIFCAYGFLFAQDMQDELIRHVEENYSNILERIPLGKEKLFGFENRDIFNQCEIGNPIRLLKIVNGSEIEITNEWRVPVLINNQYITLLRVIELEQTYEIVDMGGRVLAEIIGNHNNENEKISFMLRDYKTRTDYISFEYKSLNDRSFYKIEPPSEDFYKTTEGISLAEIIELHNIDNK